MPQLGETVTEGTITRWLKQVGDPVAEDDVLFEVSTDKVDSEVPSPVTGFIAEILVAEGETVDVGTKLAVISVDAPGAAPPAAEAEPEPEPVPEPVPEPEAEPEAKASPAPPAPATLPAGGQRPAVGSPGGAGGTRPTSDRPPSGPGSGSGGGASKV